eukprot:g6547.t1
MKSRDDGLQQPTTFLGLRKNKRRLTDDCSSETNEGNVGKCGCNESCNENCAWIFGLICDNNCDNGCDEPCLAGKYADTGNNGIDKSCVPCAKGQYQNSNYQQSCIACGHGKYTNLVQQAACKSCEAGKFMRQGLTSQQGCTACGNGKYSAGGSAIECTSCVAGKYDHDLNASTPCQNCGAGKYQNSTGQTACIFHTNCPKGSEPTAYFLSKLSSKTESCDNTQQDKVCCATCASGKFSDGDDKAACRAHTTCPIGKGVVENGRGTTHGTTEVDYNCHDCEGTTYSASDTYDVCFDAASSEAITRISASAVDCSPGYEGSAVSIGYNNRGAWDLNGCNPCVQGKYKDAVGTDSCKVCAAGNEPEKDMASTKCVDIEECNAAGVCNGPTNGTCIETDEVHSSTGERYRCDCKTGFAGNKCELQVPAPSPSPSPPPSPPPSPTSPTPNPTPSPTPNPTPNPTPTPNPNPTPTPNPNPTPTPNPTSTATSSDDDAIAKQKQKELQDEKFELILMCAGGGFVFLCVTSLLCRLRTKKDGSLRQRRLKELRTLSILFMASSSSRSRTPSSGGTRICGTHGHSHNHYGSVHPHLDSNSRALHVHTQELSVAQSLDWLKTHTESECPNSNHECCDYVPLHSTTNVLVQVRAQELITISSMNTFLALISLLYMVVNVACTIFNSYNNDCDPTEKGCSPATTPLIFHGLEFGATFVFNTVDVFAISYAPMTLSNQYRNPTLLKLVVLFNVCISALSFLLVLVNLSKFEVPSHELEYTNELTIAFFDGVILFNLLRGRSAKPTKQRLAMCIVTGSAFFVSIVQLSVYNFSGWTKDGQSLGERNAHYLEFFFGFVSAIITFWFCIDNKLVAEKQLRDIMYKGGSGGYYNYV